jgi:hypothetical protein
MAVPAAVTLWATGLTRPSRLVVVPVFSPKVATARTTSAWLDDAVRKASSATTGRGRRARRPGQVGVGEVSQRIGAEQDEAADGAVAAASRMPGGVEPRRGGSSGHAFSRATGVVEQGAPGQQPGVRPISRAPRTLPGAAVRKRAWG